MTNLFRYIEHDFAVPSRTDAIDIVNQSDFQTSLVEAAHGEAPATRVREQAGAFLTRTFTLPTDDPAVFGRQFSEFPSVLRDLTTVSVGTVREATKTLFGRTAKQIVDSADFRADKELLENAILAVKVVTGFDRVDAARLVLQLSSAALLEDLAADEATAATAAKVTTMLARPVRIPAEFLVTAPQPPVPTPPTNQDQEELNRLRARQRERDMLQSSYDTLLAIPPQRLEFIEVQTRPVPSAGAGSRWPNPRTSGPEAASSSDRAADQIAAPSILRFGRAAVEALSQDQVRALSDIAVDVSQSPVSVVVETIKRRLVELNAELFPVEVPAPAKVFRVGVHVFAETPSPPVLLANAQANEGAPHVR